MMKWVKADDNPSGPLSAKYALIKGLRLNSSEIVQNEKWLREESKKDKDENI